MCDIKADSVLMEHLKIYSVKCKSCSVPMLGVFDYSTRLTCNDCGGQRVESPIEMLNKLKITDR